MSANGVRLAADMESSFTHCYSNPIMKNLLKNHGKHPQNLTLCYASHPAQV